MKHFTRNARVLAAAVLTAGAIALVAAGSAQDGMAAKRDPLRGAQEYNQARRHQLNHDTAEAVKWFRKSADMGFFEAQFELGRRYYNGDGVPRDFVRSHMWFNLSGGRGVFFRNALEELMTPEQVIEARELARNWKPQ